MCEPRCTELNGNELQPKLQPMWKLTILGFLYCSSSLCADKRIAGLVVPKPGSWVATQGLRLADRSTCPSILSGVACTGSPIALGVRLGRLVRC